MTEDILMTRYQAVDALVSNVESTNDPKRIGTATDALMPLLTALFMDAQDAGNRKIEKLTRRLMQRTIKVLRPLVAAEEAEARNGR